MVNAETLAGGLYKLIYDYLMLSHYILKTSPRPSPTLPPSALSCARAASQHLEKREGVRVLLQNIKITYCKNIVMFRIFVEDFVWLSHCLNKMRWDIAKR